MVKKMKNKKAMPSTAVVVQPIQLPAVTETPKHKRSFAYVLLVCFLTMLDICIWGYTFYMVFNIYNSYHTYHTIRVVRPQPKHKPNVVATIGDYEISLDEVRDFVAEVPQLAELPFEQVYPNILEMMVNEKVVANGAKRYGIPEDVQIKKMVKAAEEQIIAQAFLAKKMEDVLSEADVRAVYDEEIKNFKPEEEIHARHILVPSEKQAQDILIQLKAGADFGLLADQKSIDKNAEKGDLGYFTREMMIPEFAEAVFAMKKGQLSGPVHTAYGWHIVQVEDRRLTQPPAFEKVKEQMSQLAIERKIPEIIATERALQNVRILRPTLVPQPEPQPQSQSGQPVAE